MAVSGLVTLVILVVLGGLVYSVTATALAVRQHEPSEPCRSRDHTTPAAWAHPPSTTDLRRRAGGNTRPGRQFERDDRLRIPGCGPWVCPTQAGFKSRAGRSHRRSHRRGRRWHPGSGVHGPGASTRTGAIIGVVQTSADRTEEVQLLGTLLWVLLVGGGAALLASLLAGYLYAGRALVPIRASIDRRQAALQRQREFAANASHELRTPLTVIGASVEDLKRNRRSQGRGGRRRPGRHRRRGPAHDRPGRGHAPAGPNGFRRRPGRARAGRPGRRRRRGGIDAEPRSARNAT